MATRSPPNLRIVGPADEAIVQGAATFVPLHRGVRPIDPAKLAVITRDAGMCSALTERKSPRALGAGRPLKASPNFFTWHEPRRDIRDILAASRRRRMVDFAIGLALYTVPFVVMVLVGFWLAAGRA